MNHQLKRIILSALAGVVLLGAAAWGIKIALTPKLVVRGEQISGDSAVVVGYPSRSASRQQLTKIIDDARSQYGSQNVVDIEIFRNVQGADERLQDLTSRFDDTRWVESRLGGYYLNRSTNEEMWDLPKK